MPSKFESDLAKVPFRYRAPLRLFIQQGTIPTDPLLNALLAGDQAYLVRALNDDLAKAQKVLQRHCPNFAYGSDMRLAAWEFLGGIVSKEGDAAGI